MAVYKNSEQMLEIINGLFKKVFEDPTNQKKFLKANINVKINFTDPDGTLWISKGNGTHVETIIGEADLKSDVILTQSGDTIHNFFLKHITMAGALARGLLKARGPITKVLKLVPILKTAFEVYPEQVKLNNLPLEKV